MRVGVRVEQDDAKTVSSFGGSDHRKDPGPEFGDRAGEARPGGIGEPRDAPRDAAPANSASVPPSRPSARSTTRTRAPWIASMAESMRIWRKRAVRAGGQVEARRIGAVDDVEVVIAGQHQHALGERGMRAQARQRTRPIRLEMPASVMSPVIRIVSSGSLASSAVELLQQALEPLVAARARSSALDAEAITFADHMDVGEVDDAPRARRLARRLGEARQVARLRHGGIGEAPDQRGDGEIGR